MKAKANIYTANEKKTFCPAPVCTPIVTDNIDETDVIIPFSYNSVYDSMKKNIAQIRDYDDEFDSYWDIEYEEFTPSAKEVLELLNEKEQNGTCFDSLVKSGITQFNAKRFDDAIGDLLECLDQYFLDFKYCY